MMGGIRLLIFSVLLVGFSVAAAADYLEVRRPASIKETPQLDGLTLERPDIGDLLELLDDGRQTNGYYRVLTRHTRQPGWIYRTLVRRYPGDIPTARPAAIFADQDLTGDLMRAHFINVGQGDATLLEFSCGVILIDAGGENKSITPHLIGYLEAFFENRSDLNNTIDTIFVTHTHIDHNISLREITETFKVRNYVHNGVLSGSGRHAANWMVNHGRTTNPEMTLRAVSQAEILNLGHREGLSDAAIDPLQCTPTDPEIRVLSGRYDENPGWNSGEFENGNNKSLVIRVDFGESSYLFTGDLEDAGIETLVEFYEGTNLMDIDFYQVGHHGSHNGTTGSLMKAMTPDVAVISMGHPDREKLFTAWAYGHPRKDLVDLLDKWVDVPRPERTEVFVGLGAKRFVTIPLGDAIYGTGWDGTIIVTSNPEGVFTVSTTGDPLAPFVEN